MTTALPLAAASWAIIVAALVIFISVALYYGRSTSGISQRPHGGEGTDAPGAEGPSRISSADDETEGVPDTHGTA